MSDLDRCFTSGFQGRSKGVCANPQVFFLLPSTCSDSPALNGQVHLALYSLNVHALRSRFSLSCKDRLEPIFFGICGGVGQSKARLVARPGGPLSVEALVQQLHLGSWDFRKDKV